MLIKRKTDYTTEALVPELPTLAILTLEPVQAQIAQPEPANTHPARFLTAEDLPEALAALQQARAVTLDFETTALTPWSAPVALSSTSRIGQHTIKALKQSGAVFDRTPRARVLSLSTDTGYTAAFDLDTFTSGQKAALGNALSGKVWIGHNLAFDLTWMLTLTPEVKPARIIDTMLLVIACWPSAELAAQQAAITETGRKHGQALLDLLTQRAQHKREDGGVVPLRLLSLWLLDEDMDKTYQRPHNWTGPLTPEHLDYCLGDVNAPGIIARRLLRLPDDATLDDLLSALEANPGSKAYRIFEQAIPVLAKMQRQGVGLSIEKAAELDRKLAEEASESTSELLIRFPALQADIRYPVKPSAKNPNPSDRIVPVAQALQDPAQGLTAPIKKALATAICEETGKSPDLDASGNPKLDAKYLAFTFPESQIVKLFSEIQSATKSRSMLDRYTAQTGSDGRLHPLTSINTVTGRTASQAPSMQQVPRDPRFRAIFAARPGYKILATDYSSIELRIAAALGVRAYREVQILAQLLQAQASRVERYDLRKNHRALLPAAKNLGWIFERNPGLLDYILDPPAAPIEAFPKPEPGAELADYARYAGSELCRWIGKIRAQTGGDEARLTLRSVYTSGLDPHLLTALAMQSRAGKIDLTGSSPLDYLRGLTHDQQKALKHDLKGPRQAAKAVNFGSLYGQQPAGLHRYGIVGYGLTWTLEEATEAHSAWFDLYPEIGLWHWLTRYAHRQRARILDPYNPTEIPEAELKAYRGSTLSGRPTISPKITAAGNFQDQGTGAEIALSALAKLPEDGQGMLVNLVHDELIFEVPEHTISEVKAVVERVMIEAADEYLMPYGIPTEVESEVGDAWVH